MADHTDFRFFNVIESNGVTEKQRGVSVVNAKGEFGFANDTDETPFLPAGGEKALASEGVAESLTYEHFNWGDNVKLKETIASKENQNALKAQVTQPKAVDDLTVNSIEAISVTEISKKEPKKDHQPTPAASSEGIEKDQIFSPAEDKVKFLVPAAVKKEFVQVGHDFHFKEAPEKLAFKDKGNSLNTRNDGGTVSQSMIAIAKERGWSEIKVTGSETFKKDIWRKATEQGIAVRGYKPTKIEVAEMEGKGIEIPKQGQSLSPEKKSATPEQEAAKAFKELSATEAVSKHPNLAPYIAAVAAIEKKLGQEKLSDENKQAIMQRVRQNVEVSIQQGVVPTVAIKGKANSPVAQQELSR